MSKYVDKPHGLVIGSDNWFFIVGDGDHENRTDYRAIVSTKGYTFDQFNMLNCRVETPAQQLIWQEIEIETDDENEFRRFKRAYVLQPWWADWLTREVGPIRDKWDVRSHCETPRNTIFFKRRKDALAFCKMVDEILKGVKFSQF